MSFGSLMALLSLLLVAFGIGILPTAISPSRCLRGLGFAAGSGVTDFGVTG